ncbi:hypothetical protein ABKN59_010018 [Abortiporus biennis]
MKFQTLAALCALVATVHAHSDDGVFGRRHAQLAQKRQASSSSSTSTSSSSASIASSTATGAVNNAATAASTTAAAVLPSGVPATGANGVPPLSQITSGMPTGAELAATTTYAAGTTPTAVSGAPPLPSTFVFNANNWPSPDVPPPTDSTQVQEWMKELDGVTIPDIAPTKDGECATDPTAAANAQQNGWWTCGGWTRDTDITVCPDKFTWGVSFDDGPSVKTQELLTFLEQKDITATFFVVGSRCVERPNLLIEEYMAGHEISVHTWSHRPLTSQTTEEIVAELGWTREIIKTLTGVTPVTMRPPYGDIDDRVRAISLAMGLTPIIWTRFNGFAFDTNDWQVAAGNVNGIQQMTTFENILGNATNMDTGFVVLQHDLFEITVDLAVGYTIPAALSHNPPFTLKAIGQCNSFPISNMYLETNTQKAFPYPQNVVRNSTSSTSSSSNGTSSTSGSNAGAAQKGSAVSSRNFGAILPSVAVSAAVAFFGALLL